MSYNRNNRNRNNRQRYVPPPCGKRPSNLTVVPRHNEHPERAIKRFLKKCKKLRIIETYREKTDYFEKPSTVRRKRKIRRLRAIKKANQSKDL
jgi:ribosomal protein S21